MIEPAEVLAAERAFVEAIASGRAPVVSPAIAGAVASRYLAVGTPRSFALVADSADEVAAALDSLAAHRTWFAPRDVRCAGAAADALVAAVGPGARACALADALAADIACIHAPGLTLAPAQLRRGSHLNVLAATTLDPELATLAMIAYESAAGDTLTLPRLAAGLVDGRVLDELTIFVSGRAA